MRGNNRERIFFEEDDPKWFLATLGRTSRELGWRVHSYCLMQNHYHLLLETPEANLAVGMQTLNSTYSHQTNRAYGRIGHLFQRRYGSRLLTDGEHMLEVIRYIPLNPVRADLCAEPEAWPWSSYAATLGLVPRPAFLCTSWTLALFSSDVRNARERLHLWVESGSTKRPRGVVQLPLTALLPPGRLATRQAIRTARYDHGHSARAIARHLGVGHASILRKLHAES